MISVLSTLLYVIGVLLVIASTLVPAIFLLNCLADVANQTTPLDSAQVAQPDAAQTTAPPRRNTLQRFISLLIAVSLFFLAGQMMWNAMVAVPTELSSVIWSVKQGAVRASQVQTNESTSGEITYSALVEYQYTVNDAPIVGHRITFDDDPLSERIGAESIANRYAVDTLVNVYYDPVHPQTAVLDSKPRFHLLIGSSLGGFVLFIALLFGWDAVAPKWCHIRWAVDKVNSSPDLALSPYHFFVGSTSLLVAQMPA